MRGLDALDGWYADQTTDLSYSLFALEFDLLL
jgi:hypothetical protein